MGKSSVLQVLLASCFQFYVNIVDPSILAQPLPDQGSLPVAGTPSSGSGIIAIPSPGVRQPSQAGTRSAGALPEPPSGAGTSQMPH